MKFKLTTAVAITAIALTSLVASPAAALGSKDKKVLGLVLGAATLGLILNEASKSDRRPAPSPTPGWDGYRPVPNNGYGHDVVRRDHILPRNCVTQVRGRGEALSAQCLRSAGLRHLPDNCAFEVRVDSGRGHDDHARDRWGNRYDNRYDNRHDDDRRRVTTETVYGAQCLNDRGYRISRR
jgi:hypothetical protein